MSSENAFSDEVVFGANLSFVEDLGLFFTYNPYMTVRFLNIMQNPWKIFMMDIFIKISWLFLASWKSHEDLI